MKELYLANSATLSEYDQPGCHEWGDIYKLISLNVALVDRQEKIRLPFRFRLYDAFRMPTDLTGFDLTYEQCCERRATEIIDLSRRLDKPIHVLYSGGIDSTLVLVSFMKALSPQEFHDRVVVALSWDSVVENPRFYHDHIRSRCRTVSSDRIGSMMDGRCILVGGEHNDQLLGADTAGAYYRMFGFDDVKSVYDRAKITRFLMAKGMSQASADHWFDILDAHARSAPCEVRTVFEFLWWLNFCFKWQSVFFRILLRVDKNLRGNIDQTFIDDHFHHFFSTDYFQKWSMLNPDLKIRDSWDSYKFHAKDVIYGFNGDAEYRDNKVKRGSLARLFQQKDTPMALTTDYQYLYALDPEEFYDPDNHFRRN